MENENLFAGLLPSNGKVEQVHKINDELIEKENELKMMMLKIADSIVGKIKERVKDEKILQLIAVAGLSQDSSGPYSREPMLRGLVASSLKLSENKKIRLEPGSHTVLSADIRKIYNNNDMLTRAINNLNEEAFDGRPVIKFIADSFLHGNSVVHFTFNR